MSENQIDVSVDKESQLVALAPLATLPQGQILAANTVMKEYFDQCFNPDGSINFMFLPEYQESDSPVRQIKETQADKVIYGAYLQAAVILFFKNDRDLGRQILHQAFSAINSCKIVIEKRYNAYDGDCAPCACSYAESLAYIADNYGFHDISAMIARSTCCPSWDRYRTAPLNISDRSDITIERVQQNICEKLARRFCQPKDSPAILSFKARNYFSVLKVAEAKRLGEKFITAKNRRKNG